MKTIKYLFILTTLICLVAFAGCKPNADSVPESSDATTVTSYTPSAEELAVISEINYARTDPKDYVTHRLSVIDLSKKSDSYKAALDELVDKMTHMNDLPALTSSLGLTRCAAEWVNISGPEGYVGHDSSIAKRFKKYCSYASLGENCSYGYSTAIDIVVALLIDDGVEDRGHRNNILSSAYKNVGAAIGPHKKYETMCCIDFAYGYQEK